jgi:hypothetical protein
MNPTPARVDLYRDVHKGLRACLSHVLLEVGRMDTNDDDDTAQGLASVRQLLALCASHLEKEDTFLHAAMQARRPDSAATTLADHEDHKRAFARIEAAVRAVETAAPLQRAAAAQALYAQLAGFVAENLEHMQVEETHNNEVLWATHTDAELLAIKASLLAAIPRELNLAFLRWMVPALRPAERAALFIGARAGMPPAAFDAAVALVRNHLSARDWFKLQLALAPLRAAA